MSLDNFVRLLTPEQRQELLKSLAIDEDQDSAIKEITATDTDDKITSTDTNVKEDFTVTRKTRGGKVVVKAKKNTWTDDGELRDVDTPEFTKTPRNRSRPKKKEVECHICGRQAQINESLIYGEFFRCNQCTGR